MAEMLRVEEVEKYYGNKSNLTKAIDKISLSVDKGNLRQLWDQADPEKQHC